MAIPYSLSLIGHVAVVTGAGSPTGIGWASARALGDLGAEVVITATTDRIHERVEELTALGITAHGILTTLDTESGASALHAGLETLGLEPDILVNNAGMVISGEDMLGGGADDGTVVMSLADWDRGMAINLSTAFLATRTLIPALRRSGHGRVVTVSSVSGPVMASRGDVAYATAKAGLTGFTRALAVDEAQYGVTANAVAPGWIATGSQLESEVEEGTLVPLRRSGTAAEVASVVVWLASPGAAYVTGQTIVVDGGNSIAEERR